jgi:hypothetical protein
MDNERHGIRASGNYATYQGRVYFGNRIRDRVRLLSDENPPPPGFQTSAKSWVTAEALVDIADIQHLDKVQTVCVWRGHRFEVGIIVGDTAYVYYLGNNFDEVCQLPGMERPDKFEVVGEIPVSELIEVEEHVVEVPLGHEPGNATERRDE